MKRTLSRLHASAPCILLVLIASVVVVLFVGAYYSTQEANAYTYDTGSCNAFNPCTAEFKCAGAANFGSCLAGYIGSSPWSSGVYPPVYPSCATSAYPTESSYNACGAAISPAAVTVTPSEGSSIPRYTYPDGIPPSNPTVSYSASASGGSAPYTYAWYAGSSASGSVVSTASTYSQEYTSAGTKYVTVVVRTSTGQQTMVTRSVNVVDTPSSSGSGYAGGTHYSEGLNNASLNIGGNTYTASISANTTTIAPGESVTLTHTVSAPYCVSGNTPTSYDGASYYHERTSTYSALYPDNGSDFYFTSPNNITLVNQGCSGGRTTFTGTQTIYPTATTPWAINYWIYANQGEGSCVGVGGGCYYSLYWWQVKAYTPAFTINVVPLPPTATLTANPTSVVQGNSSTLTWSSTNATSCTGTNFSTGGTTSGSLSVVPGSTTSYSVTCTGPGGSASASAPVTVIPALTASCSVSPTSITTGQSATWTAAASGGTGSYTYSWTGTDSLTGTGASVAKTYSITGTKTASVTVVSDSQSRTVACSNSLSVTPETLYADLTAGSVSPTSATAGQAVVLSATATNIDAGVSDSFPLLFQVESPSSLQNSSYLSGLVSGASGSGSVSHTFASAGTYNVRACANFNTGWTAIVTESNYGNNCGPWTAITIAAAAPTTLSCTVSDASVAPGESVTYTAFGASAPYTWTPSDGVGSYGTGATAARTFSTAASYGMQVSKSGYTSGNCPVVVVGTPSCGTASAQITANPNRVRADNNSGTTLTFSATGVDSGCTVSGPNIADFPVTPNACSVGSQTLDTPQITEQSVYTITCDGEASAQAVVNLIPAFIEF